jgi:hypothetical protein
LSQAVCGCPHYIAVSHECESEWHLFFQEFIYYCLNHITTPIALDVLEAEHYYWFILCSDSREEEEGVEGEED